MQYHSSWTDEAKNNFENIILTHGGWNAWSKLDNFKFGLRKFKGALVYAKGLNRSFFTPKEIIVSPKDRKTEFIYESHKDIYENGSVFLSLGNHKSIENGRDLFKKSTFEQWHPEHAAYFFGYAWVNYLSYPFILPEFELLSYKVKSGIASRFEISFPPDFHTHCQIQVFYFNQENFLQRHDYHAECAGPLVFGAHTTEAYTTYKGIQVAQVRKVRPRVGSISLPIYGIYGEVAL